MFRNFSFCLLFYIPMEKTENFKILYIICTFLYFQIYNQIFCVLLKFMVEGKVPARLLKDFNELMTINPIEGVTAVIDETNGLKWSVTIVGPKGTPYEGGKFKTSFVFHENYPFKSPIVKFETKIYHPHILQKTGELCTQVYENDWVPTKKASSIVQTLISILLDPSADQAIEPEIAQEIATNKEQFLKKAADWTKTYAK